MLTSDLVRGRVKDGALALAPLGRRRSEDLLAYAAALIDATAGMIGAARADVLVEWARVEAPARDRLLVDGLRKLIDDRCTFAASVASDPAALRADVFARAARARRELQRSERFDREAILVEAGRARGLSAHEVEEGLFADLKEAHRLVRFDALSASALVDLYFFARVQAVLLRAVCVDVTVEGARPEGLRALIHRLKFLQLMFVVEEGEGGHRFVIDGPMSLFSASTRYGVRLAMALPLLASVGRCRVDAEVRWGKQRRRASFSWTSDELLGAELELPAFGDREEVEALKAAVAELGGPWRADSAANILTVEGVGLVVPDLVFVNTRTGEQVFFELLGHWSRDAVWRRVEMVERGLCEPMVFGISAALRVSERALGEDAASALYVFKKTPSARRLVAKIEEVAARVR